jgi:hypothetical protein
VLAGLIVSSVLWRSTKPTARNAVLSTTALAAFVVLSYNGAVLNSMLRNEYDVGAGVRQVKSVLPADARLASLGLVPHQFEYFYDGPIRRVDWPQTAGDLPADVEYVCFPVRRGIPTTPPIAYEEIASIPMNRSLRGEPSLRVVVGRVVRNGTTAPASSS